MGCGTWLRRRYWQHALKEATYQNTPKFQLPLRWAKVVKVYDGDVENDLCLSFSVEEEQFGARSTVELRDGGAAIPVTADNRIEYVHLVADYHLNKKLAPQAKAFVAGLHAVVPPGWLRLFSAPELQRLVNGDDAPVDVGDLRKHTRYAAGYTAMSPTVRDLWAVVGEIGRAGRQCGP